MQTLFGPFRPREMATKIGNVSKVASVDDTPSVDFGRTTFANCGSHPRHSDDSRHCVPAEGPRGLCLEPTSNGSTEYCALRATTMRKGFYLMPQVKCGTSETCNGMAMGCSSSNNWGHLVEERNPAKVRAESQPRPSYQAIIPFSKEREKFWPSPVYVFQHNCVRKVRTTGLR